MLAGFLLNAYLISAQVSLEFQYYSNKIDLAIHQKHPQMGHPISLQALIVRLNAFIKVLTNINLIMYQFVLIVENPAGICLFKSRMRTRIRKHSFSTKQRQIASQIVTLYVHIIILCYNKLTDCQDQLLLKDTPTRYLKKRCFEKYWSCAKAYQFSDLYGVIQKT